MAAGARVLSGVAIRRAVAAQRRPALLTRPQMDPLCAGLHALIALPALRVLDRRHRAEMRASYIRHPYLPFIHSSPGWRREPPAPVLAT
jgi:hypothetical protein